MSATNTVTGAIPLGDEPAQQDAFGPHTKIADAVLGLVLGDSPRANTIGLTGRRGSGKSTVVRLIKINSANNRPGRPALRTLVFDAWGHEADPLRRAFLEELVIFLRGNRDGAGAWLDERTAERHLGLLAARRTTTKTTTRSKLTPRGLTLAFLGLLVPVGAGLIALRARPLLVDLGLFLLSAPFLYTLAFIVGKISEIRREKRQNRSPSSGRPSPVSEGLAKWWAEVLRRVADVFASDSEATEQVDSLTSPDPSSVEFRTIFKEVLDAALGYAGDRRLLIVLDNLDRLPPEQRAKLWSVMRTYTEEIECSAENAPWARRVWTLVAMSATAAEDGEPTPLVGAASATKDPLDRAFQIQFTVPPPLLSDWGRYMEQLAAEALPGWSKCEIQAAAAQYEELLGSRIGPAPTPRDLKLFINKLVAYQLTAPTVAPSTMAALAAIVTGDPTWEPRKPVPAWAMMPGAEHPRRPDLAGLYFQTTPERALQILYDAEIYAALEKGDHEGMQALFNSCPELGPTVAQRLRRSVRSWIPTRAALLGSAAAALASTAGDGELAMLGKEARGVEEFPDLDAISASGLALLVARDHALAAPILKAAARGVVGARQDDRRVRGLATLLESISANSGAKRAIDEFEIDCPPEGYVPLIGSEAATAHPGAVAYLRPAVGTGPIVTRLRDTAQTADANWASAVSGCAIVKAEWDWAPLLSQIGDLLNQQSQPDRSAALIAGALYLGRSAGWEAISATLMRVRNSGPFLTAGQNLSGPDLARWALAVALADPNPNLWPQPWQAARNKYVAVCQGSDSPGATEVAAAAMAVGAVRALLEKQSAWPAGLNRILAAAAGSPDFPLPSDFLGKRIQLREILESNAYHEHLQRLQASIASEILERGQFLVGDADLYVELLNAGQSSQLTAFLNRGLWALETDQWLAALKAGGHILEIARAHLVPATDTAGSVALRDALERLAQEAIRVQAAPTTDGNTVRLLCDRLRPNNRTNLMRSVFGLVAQAGKSTGIVHVLALFGEPLVAWHAPEDVGKDFVCTCLKAILERRAEPEIEWAAKFAEAQGAVRSAPADCRAELYDRIALLPDHTAALDRLAGAIALPNNQAEQILS